MGTDTPFSTPPPAEPSRGPWLGLGIGFAIVIAILIYLFVVSRSSESRYDAHLDVMQSAPADTYAGKLAISDVHMSVAENMLGGESMYVEGNIANTGDKTVVGATVEVTFKNSLDQVVQRENQPLMVVRMHEPAIDVAAVNLVPLNPGATKEFRLTFERVSADWNRQYPMLRVTTVTLK